MQVTITFPGRGGSPTEPEEVCMQIPLRCSSIYCLPPAQGSELNFKQHFINLSADEDFINILYTCVLVPENMKPILFLGINECFYLKAFFFSL